ncbi:MAG: Ig-like domain-containing protein [Patescibacteria group bacterium]
MSSHRRTYHAKAAPHPKLHRRHPHHWVVNPVLVENAFHQSLGRGALFVLIGLLAIALAFASPSPETGQSAAATIGIQEPLRIRFTKPILKDAVTPSIKPAIEGTWSFTDPVIEDVLYRELTFSPAQEYLPETTHHVVLTDLVSLTSIYPTTSVYQFTTTSYPAIQSASLINEAKEVLPCEPLTLTLDQTISQVGAFTITTDPAQPLDITLSENGNLYVVRPTECFRQGQNYLLLAEPSLEAGKASSSFTLAFSTLAAPSATLVDLPSTGVEPELDSLTLELSSAPKSVNELLGHLTIEPTLEGTWRTDNETHLVFSPSQSLEHNTAYTVTIPRGTVMQNGGIFESDTRLGFSTLGPVRVISLTPRAGASNVNPDTAIGVTFDQAVNHPSAEQAFSISPGVAGSFSWSGNTLTFAPKGLERNATYTVQLTAGIKGTRGPASTHATRATFSTQELSTTLNIPNDRQDLPLSCEVAALKMALNYKGAGVSENELLNALGIDEPLTRGDTWGNPNIAFVGSVTGRQNSTGYGAHWGPIARISNAYRPSQAFSGWTVGDVAHEIEAGNPVEIWGTTGRAQRDSWQTPSGASISAWVGEHTRLVIGFTGTADDPTRFIINDPAAGRLTWTTNQFKSNWAAFGNSGVVIR